MIQPRVKAIDDERTIVDHIKSHRLIYMSSGALHTNIAIAALPLRKNHTKSTCGFCVLLQFHMFNPDVSVMLRDRSPHEPHMWPHVGHMSDTGYVFAEPHMCLTCEKSCSHVGKRVKLEQHMWATCEHMWATCGPHVDSM